MAQDGKFVVIKDADTLKVIPDSIKLFLGNSKQLVRFNSGEKLIYPKLNDYNSIQYVCVTVNQDTLSFFDVKMMAKTTTLPSNVIKFMKPNYSSVFMSKQNLYLIFDKYPFESEDREELGRSQSKQDDNLTVVELYYQISEMHTYLP